MGFNMKERRNKVSQPVYEKDGKRLIKEALQKREEVLEKYKNVPHLPGLDTDPSAKELGEVTRWFGNEIAKLKKKYEIK